MFFSRCRWSDSWTHSRGNILIPDCDENLNWYKGCRKKHGSKNAQRRTQRAPWHNRLEACQVVAFLAFISGCGVAEGGWARLAEQSRAGGILQGEGRREREGVKTSWIQVRKARERGRTWEAKQWRLTPPLPPVSSLAQWTGGRCSDVNTHRGKRETGNNMEVMFVWSGQEWSILFFRLLCRPVSEGEGRRGPDTGDGHRNSRSQGPPWQSVVLAGLDWTGIQTSPGHE